jgi:tocopherol O-methyltransferase
LRRGHIFFVLPIKYPDTGSVRVLDLDIDQMGERLGGDQGEKLDCVWSSEVIFHLHERQLFFNSAFMILQPKACLVIADIFRTAAGPALSSKGTQKELTSIRRNHICPELGTADEYTKMAQKAGFRIRHEPIEIIKNVTKTW